MQVSVCSTYRSDGKLRQLEFNKPRKTEKWKRERGRSREHRHDRKQKRKQKETTSISHKFVISSKVSHVAELL